MRYLWLAFAIACSSEPVAPAAPAARSPDEQTEVEPPSAIEASGGFAAAMHIEAVRARAREPARAAALLSRACDHGYTASCMALAEMLEAGDGIAADPDRAAEILDRACFEGSTEACDHLGH